MEVELAEMLIAEAYRKQATPILQQIIELDISLERQVQKVYGQLPCLWKMLMARMRISAPLLMVL